MIPIRRSSVALAAILLCACQSTDNSNGDGESGETNVFIAEWGKP